MYLATTTKNSLSRPQVLTKTLAVVAGEGRGEGAFKASSEAAPGHKRDRATLPGQHRAAVRVCIYS